ncbi:MAG TPA: mechanosensitive ion channel family protein [Actinobacteria bacterium]|mgnify:CR=1 FL=1|nr:mechanosensitive ion channel family protein [Actinomycetota bacterium]
MSKESNAVAFDSRIIIENLKSNWLNILIVIAAVIIIVLIIKLVSRKIKKTLDTKISPEKAEIKKRSYTFSTVTSNIIIGLTVFAGLLIIADQFGISIAPIITGAGIVSVIVGLGAQSLVKDLINGSFILFEQWYQINDVIEVGNVSGIVEKFSLRTTAIRSIDGVIHYIPNSEIKILSNKTQEWSRAVISIGVSYKENTDRIISELKTILNDFSEEKEYKKLIIKKPEILGEGIDELGEYAVKFKIICKVKSSSQWLIERRLRKRIKDRFDELGIEIPFPCNNVYIKNHRGV